mmetsp:Transcript_55343/g.129102  ORF Transcript_55343/g.129102 Transcript_55343/m.129102 type:complete len:313 (+) Transcript_55343:60-998(+)
MSAVAAMTMAQQLEMFVLAAGNLKSTAPSSCEVASTQVGTDLDMQTMTEWEQAAEAELGSESNIEATREKFAELAKQEESLDEELDALQGQLKQEKGFNHQENQGHQQKLKKLQQMLQKYKKEDASRKKAAEVKADKAKEKFRAEKEELVLKLAQAKELNHRLKLKLNEPQAEKDGAATKKLKAELYMLNISCTDESDKARLLTKEVGSLRMLEEKQSYQIESETAKLEAIHENMERLRLKSEKNLEKIRALAKKRDELLAEKEHSKEYINALRCKRKVAKAKYQDMHGLPYPQTFSSSKSSRSKKSDEKTA